MKYSALNFSASNDIYGDKTYLQDTINIYTLDQGVPTGVHGTSGGSTFSNFNSILMNCGVHRKYRASRGPRAKSGWEPLHQTKLEYIYTVPPESILHDNLGNHSLQGDETCTDLQQFCLKTHTFSVFRKTMNNLQILEKQRMKKIFIPNIFFKQKINCIFLLNCCSFNDYQF